MKKLLILLLVTFGSYAQSVVKDTANVKKPAEGKLYYAKNTQQLYLYRKGFEPIGKAAIHDGSPVIIPASQLQEIHLGYWENSDRILVAKLLGGKYHLLQTNQAHTYYVPRGKNLLNNPRTKINSDIFTGDIVPDIVSTDSELGGLFPPATFKESLLTDIGYIKNSQGEYTKKITTTQSQTSGNITIPNSLKLSPEETKKNWVSWENFIGREVSLPKGHDAILGFGSPIFSDDPITKDGSLLYLKLGYTHVANVTAFPKHLNRYKEENIFVFTHPSQLIQYSALGLMQNIKNGGYGEFYPSGYSNGGRFGDLERLAFPNDGTDYRGITYEGSVELGKYMYYSRAWGLDPATGNLEKREYSIPQRKSWLMLDEEQIPNSLGGIGKMIFLAGINSGIKLAAPDVKPVWYAVPMTFFFHTNQNPENISDNSIQEELLNGSLTFNHIGFKEKGFWFDSGIYVKVPTITSHDKYVKDANGKFIIQNGKRVWNKENFTETIYGEETKFLGEPEDGIKYWLHRKSDNAGLIGSQYWDGIPNNPRPKQEYLSQGYESWGKPNPSTWKPETQLNTEFYYGFANAIMLNLIAGSRVEYNNTDISKFRNDAKVLNYVELRLKTEEFTAGGNSTKTRQIGSGILTFCQLYSYLSGVRAVSLWENGKDYGYDLPKRGTQLYPSDNAYQLPLENWSGLTHRTDALIKMCEDLKGSNPENWTYVHFTYPVVVQNREGVISSGIYTGNKFVFVMINPTLNFDETQEVTLKIKDKDYKIELNGNGSPHYGVIDLHTGLTNNDFSLSYSTIYGKEIVVSGKVNGKINESVISGL
jgi:hypothetical protein